jgi:hypothetical protein
MSFDPKQFRHWRKYEKDYPKGRRFFVGVIDWAEFDENDG